MTKMVPEGISQASQVPLFRAFSIISENANRYKILATRKFLLARGKGQSPSTTYCVSLCKQAAPKLKWLSDNICGSYRQLMGQTQQTHAVAELLFLQVLKVKEEIPVLVSNWIFLLHDNTFIEQGSRLIYYYKP